MWLNSIIDQRKTMRQDRAAATLDTVSLEPAKTTNASDEQKSEPTSKQTKPKKQKKTTAAQVRERRHGPH